MRLTVTRKLLLCNLLSLACAVFLLTLSWKHLSDWIAVPALVAIAMSAVCAYVVTSGITASLRGFVTMMDRVRKGDLTIRADMGTPVNCSAAKQCGKTACRVFGKENFCWVEAGIFNNHPHCPFVLKGGDCRACWVYKKHVNDEIQEMGSAVNGMLNELQIKADCIRCIAEGDLTVTVSIASDADALGQSMERMVRNLHDLVERITFASCQTNQNAEQIAQAGQSLSQGATESAASLEGVASSMTVINDQLRVGAGIVATANELALKTRASAEQGNREVAEMVTAMADMQTAGKEIAIIVKVIDDIAFQTNLLALNAAVEAARAGHHGKGFSVVAGEVRSLAGRSATAASETAQRVEDTVRKLALGATIADRTQASLREIETHAVSVTELLRKIADASQKESEEIAQIDSDLSQINQVTMQNSSHAEETASVAEELLHQATALRRLIEQFRIEKTQSEICGAGSETMAHPDECTQSAQKLFFG